jgi:carbonic anhydrase
MSCDNASAPLDLITDLNALDKCNVICDYKANYAACRGIAVNKGIFLSIKMDNCNSEVKYNSEGFILKEVRIYQPSLHAWGAEKADGEVIIIHDRKVKVKDKPDELFVCIPIKSGNSSLDGSWFSFLSSIPPYFDNADIPPAVINYPNWTLNSIIPKGDYYNYQGTSPFVPCSNQVEVIVYSLSQAAICPNVLFQKLKGSIPKDFEPSVLQYRPDRLHKLYYHTAKPLLGGQEALNDVFLDCQDVDGDTPEDANIKSVEPAKEYRGMETGVEVSTTKIPYSPILITGGTILGVILVIKAWGFFKKKSN